MQNEYEFRMGVCQLYFNWITIKHKQTTLLRARGQMEQAAKWEQCHMLEGMLDESNYPLVTREQLIDLLETPQGIEMVTKYKLVDRRLMRQLAGHNIPQYGLFLRGNYKITDPQTRNGVIIAAHHCNGLTVQFTQALHPSPVVVALHGAVVHVVASGNAVCRVVKDAESQITIAAKDEAVILSD